MADGREPSAPPLRRSMSREAGGAAAAGGSGGGAGGAKRRRSASVDAEAAAAAAAARAGGNGNNNKTARTATPNPGQPSSGAVDDAELEADLAAAVGLDPVNLCDAEESHLPPLPDGFDEAAYCRVRNHVLALWRADVTRYLPAAEAPGAIMPRYASYATMAWKFLNDHGFINFGLVRPGGVGAAAAAAAAAAGGGSGGGGTAATNGNHQTNGNHPHHPPTWAAAYAGAHRTAYHQPPHPPPPLAAPLPDASESRKTVIVVGAGLSGLACARQLRSAGLRVVVLEARARLGGRVHSKRLEAPLPPGAPGSGIGAGGAGGPAKAVGIADLGGSIITGLDGNPLAVLARQMGLPLHDIDASDVPLHLEGAGGAEPDRSLDEDVHGAFNAVVDRATELREELPRAAGELLSMQSALDGLLARRQAERERRAARSRRERQRRQEERRAWAREKKRLKQQGNGNGAGGGVGNDDAAAANAPPPTTAPAPAAAAAALPPPDPAAAVERLLFQWHMANVEFASAQRLPQLSAKHWDIDDAHEFMGAHCFPPGGALRIAASLAEGLPVLYRCPATLVRYSRKEGVVVHTASAGVLAADAVVVTVPLGVLKVGEREPGALRFDPPLPARKRLAIRRLGFGVLNKCMLLFPHCFWGGRDMFGHVPSDPARRGEYYLFYSYDQVSGGALLGALVAGDAALDFESRPAGEAVARVMAVLRSIFQPLGVEVPPPLTSACTRWRADPWARGSYSSVAPGGLGPADYDALAEPVGGRVFFAGEATTHKWPATMHGAFLSGLREAARVKRALLGGVEEEGAEEEAGAVSSGGAAATAADVQARAAAAAAVAASLPPAATRAVESTCRDAERLAALFGLSGGTRGGGAFGLGAGGAGGAAAGGGDGPALPQQPPEPDLQFGCFTAFFGPRFSEYQDEAIVAVDAGDVLGLGGADGALAATAGGAGGAGAAAAQNTPARRTTTTTTSSSDTTNDPRVVVHALLTQRQLLALQDADGGDEVRLALLAAEMGVRLFGRSSGLSRRARHVLRAIADARLGPGFSGPSAAAFDALPVGGGTRRGGGGG